MENKKICPHCGNKTFFADAEVVQKWEIDNQGKLIKVKEDYVKILKEPDPGLAWTCSRCGAAAIDEKEFPFDQNDFVIFCESLQHLKTVDGKVGKSCYLSIKKEEEGVHYVIYNKEKQKVFERTLYKTFETETLLDSVEDILDMLFGMQGVKIAIFHMNHSYCFKLVQM